MVSVPPWTNATSLAPYSSSEAWLPLRTKVFDPLDDAASTMLSVPVPSVTVLPPDRTLMCRCHYRR
jgi:hypothetical protein